MADLFGNMLAIRRKQAQEAGRPVSAQEVAGASATAAENRSTSEFGAQKQALGRQELGLNRQQLTNDIGNARFANRMNQAAFDLRGRQLEQQDRQGKIDLATSVVGLGADTYSSYTNEDFADFVNTVDITKFKSVGELQSAYDTANAENGRTNFRGFLRWLYR